MSVRNTRARARHTHASAGHTASEAGSYARPIDWCIAQRFASRNRLISPAAPDGHGPDINAKTTRQMTALHEATGCDNVSTLESLLYNEAKIEEMNEDRNTALGIDARASVRHTHERVETQLRRYISYLPKRVLSARKKERALGSDNASKRLRERVRAREWITELSQSSQ